MNLSSRILCLNTLLMLLNTGLHGSLPLSSKWMKKNEWTDSLSSDGIALLLPTTYIWFTLIWTESPSFHWTKVPERCLTCMERPKSISIKAAPSHQNKWDRSTALKVRGKTEISNLNKFNFRTGTFSTLSPWYYIHTSECFLNFQPDHDLSQTFAKSFLVTIKKA